MPEAPRLHGHSDGDAALHAVCDALLAAAGLGDLGRLFPAGDPATRGIDSRQLLGSVVDRLAAAGWRPSSLDLTIARRTTSTRRRCASTHARRPRGAARGGRSARVSVKASTGNLAGDEGAGRVIRATALVGVVAAMTLHFRNTLGGALEPFQPLEPGHVRIYSCGPDGLRAGPRRQLPQLHLRGPAAPLPRLEGLRGHLGDERHRCRRQDHPRRRHARASRIGDLTARHTADLPGRPAPAAHHHRPTCMPRATEHIPEMAELIGTLLEKGHAYRTDDGSIFFRISSWPAYGRLARLDPTSSASASASRPTSTARTTCATSRSGRVPGRASRAGRTAIGEGRPGWHIECSAMSMRYLGPSFDIHTGGIDLVFPHHEDEIAQSEAATGKPFVQTWLHCAHLQMGGQKMAKRTGNFARPADIYADGASRRAPCATRCWRPTTGPRWTSARIRWQRPRAPWSGCRRCSAASTAIAQDGARRCHLAGPAG